MAATRTVTFTATVMAADHAEALARVARRLQAGWTVTGRVSTRSARHQLVDVEVTGSGRRNDLWVVLTSYGITPSSGLGSIWQTVGGVGC